MSGFVPEIVNDELSRVIEGVVASLQPEMIIEIGSANGMGSTQALLRGRKKGGLEKRCSIFCLEMIPERYEELVSNVRNEPFVVAENVSSVAQKHFLTEEEVDEFIEKHSDFGIAKIGAEMVKGWLRRDLELIRDKKIKQDWLTQFVLYGKLNRHRSLVVIDGSPFTGLAEYEICKGADVIIMDDIMDIKCWDAYERAKNSGEYDLIQENKNLRNGYAVFRKAL